MVVRELLWSTDGTTLYGLAGRSGEAAMQVVAWAGATGELRTVTRTDSAKAGLQRAGAHHLVYTLRGGAVVGGGGRGNVPGGGASFEVLDLRDGRTRRFAGRNVAVARDSGVVAWLEGNGPFVLKRLVLDGDAEPETLLRSTLPLASPALSPSGAKVAYQQMPREDWEIFVRHGGRGPAHARDARDPARPLPAVPHRGPAPRGDGRGAPPPLALYDLTSGTRTRLFHNNTVRTVAPEYEWVPSPDGSRVAIVSERDGDTVTPHRHLYVTDLTQPRHARGVDCPRRRQPRGRACAP
jgi:hypothetical protein